MQQLRTIQIIAGLIFLVNGFSQSNEVVNIVKPEQHGEELTLFVDRPVYLVSDDIHFSALYLPPLSQPAKKWSSVIYVELISWDGTKVAQSVYEISDNVATGSLTIPGSINTGNYYLRGYTKWMRNYSPLTYTYLPVKVVNPYSDKVATGPEEDVKNLNTVSTHFTDISGQLKLTDLKESYSKREQVRLSININGQYAGKNASIMVLKLGLDYHTDLSFSFDESADSLHNNEIEFFPELYGLTLSGKITNEKGEPVSGAEVNLSSFSDAFYFYGDLSDQNGKFGFVLPKISGDHEFHIEEAADTTTDNNLLVDNQFCNQPVTLPWFPFKLSEDEKEYLNEYLLNFQIQQRFKTEPGNNSENSIASGSFYGNPSSTVFVDEYIELVDLREFFYELVHDVSVDYIRQEPFLRINGQGSLSMYPPLVLLDNVSVPNGPDLLKLPSKSVQKIEVVNRGYMIGKKRYSGIIKIFSKNKDLAGLILRNDHHFFTYMLYNDASLDAPSEDVSIPDKRTVLYNRKWMADHAGSGEIVFTTSDVEGVYDIIIRYLDPQTQKIFYGRESFRVR
ncbi:MAG: carboxypeptidase-like regulatory domain-containing protein [Bacteroidales bacterium]|nr:carboxypeptidase-like regulatory domain-containing protein [Bacteroidales bacterium]